MLVRLLVAVLMVTGPIPVRICTCAAAGTPKAPAGSSSGTASLPETVKGCGCGHRPPPASGSAPAAGADFAHDHADPAVGSPNHSPPHDRDCPAANPRPVVSAAVLTPAADLPADPGVGLFVPVALPVSNRLGVTLQVRPTSGRLAVPLYLSLLSLRI